MGRYYRANPLGKKADSYLCVAMLYDEFTKYAETAEEFALTSFLYDGIEKRETGGTIGFTYQSNAPISECRNCLRMTRGQRGHALKRLKSRKLVENDGVWQSDDSDYFIPGTQRYKVDMRFALGERSGTFYMGNKDIKREQRRDTFTPIYGWMVRETGNFDELILLAFIVRKHRAQKESSGKQTIVLSNRYVRYYTGLSFYATRKALRGLEKRGLIRIIPQKAQGEARRISVTEKLIRLVEQHQKAMAAAEIERTEKGFSNLYRNSDYLVLYRRRGKVSRQFHRMTRKQQQRIEKELSFY